jgi:hypothetical protein
MIGSSVGGLDRTSHMGAFGGGQKDIDVATPPGATVEGATTCDVIVGAGTNRARYVISATGVKVIGDSDGAAAVSCDACSPTWLSAVCDAMLLLTSDGVDSTSMIENAIVTRTSALHAMPFALIVSIYTI